MTRGLWALAALALLVSPLVAQDAQSFDLIIRAGRVVDGTGNPWVQEGAPWCPRTKKRIRDIPGYAGI